MKPPRKPLIQFLLTTLFICSTSLLFGQDSLRLMAYNLLNFPDPNPAGKADTLRKIIDFVEPDVLMVCELKTAAGAMEILDDALNDGPFVQYKMADFTSNTSGGGTSLQQMLFYDQNKLELYSQQAYRTNVRDINKYTLYVKDPFLAGHFDTTFLDFYVVHLKAGNTPSDAAQRAQMVDTLNKYIAAAGPNRQVAVAGDFNVYSSTEAAYESLIDPFNPVWMRDPINTAGAWSANFSFAQVHTQSTRTSSIFGDGTGGGLDDRFDFILLSSNALNSSGRATYVNGSYKALGNDGSCYNGSITSCGSTTAAIRNSLFYMSDHLPVILDLAVELPTLSSINDEQRSELHFPAGNLISDQLQISGLPERATDWVIFDQAGRRLLQGRLNAAFSADNTLTLTFDPGAVPPGLYFIQVVAEDGKFATGRFALLR